MMERTKKKWSEHELGMVLEWLDKGVCFESIAKMMGRSEGAVRARIETGSIPISLKALEESVRRRWARGKKKWSFEEKRKLLEMSIEGKTRTEIGNTLRRSPSAVRVMLIKLKTAEKAPAGLRSLIEKAKMPLFETEEKPSEAVQIVEAMFAKEDPFMPFLRLLTVAACNSGLLSIPAIRKGLSKAEAMKVEGLLQEGFVAKPKAKVSMEEIMNGDSRFREEGELG